MCISTEMVYIYIYICIVTLKMGMLLKTCKYVHHALTSIQGERDIVQTVICIKSFSLSELTYFLICFLCSSWKCKSLIHSREADLIEPTTYVIINDRKAFETKLLPQFSITNAYQTLKTFWVINQRFVFFLNQHDCCWVTRCKLFLHFSLTMVSLRREQLHKCHESVFGFLQSRPSEDRGSPPLSIVHHLCCATIK
jgi:hypothetical protein